MWERSIQAIGPVPKKQRWIYVRDRGSDIYTFWQTCEQLGYDFVVSVAQDRRVLVAEEPESEDLEVQRLKTLARSLLAQGGRVLHVPASASTPGSRCLSADQRAAKCVSNHPSTGRCSRKRKESAWIVRVWEPEPPQGARALEWILVTTVPISCAQDARARVIWYKWRWLLENFHKVLKTGCGIEVRRQQTRGAMWNLLGILTPIAMRLLWLRQAAQQAPDTPATEVVSQEVIDVVTKLDNRPGALLTTNDL